MKSVGALLALVLRHALPLQAVENVATHGLPWKQREVLKHDAAVGPGTGNVLAIDRESRRFRPAKSRR